MTPGDILSWYVENPDFPNTSYNKKQISEKLLVWYTLKKLKGSQSWERRHVLSETYTESEHNWTDINKEIDRERDGGGRECCDI